MTLEEMIELPSKILVLRVKAEMQAHGRKVVSGMVLKRNIQ